MLDYTAHYADMIYGMMMQSTVHPLYGYSVCYAVMRLILYTELRYAVLHCSRVSAMCSTKCDYMTNYVYTMWSGDVRNARDG